MARERIASVAVMTPLLHSRWLSDLTGRDVVLKLECLQDTGSFKLRGAANRILSLPPEMRERGVIACSSGNHGLATARVAAELGILATICVPDWVDPAKLRAIRETGAEVVVEGQSAEASEAVSLRLQQERGLTYVHPFDDREVIAGQGTVGAEILEQLPEVTMVVVPASGGGLVSGVAVAFKASDPGIQVIAATAERAGALAASVREGRLVALPEEQTVASALAGNLGERNRYTVNLVTRLVDRVIPVPEESIRQAMRELYRRHRLVVEGGGAVAVAALANGPRMPPGGPVAAVISGGNIDLSAFQRIVDPVACEQAEGKGL